MENNTALMTGDEVAALFRVDPKTVQRWRNTGKIPPHAVGRTPGGQHRYITAEIRKLYQLGGLAGPQEGGSASAGRSFSNGAGPGGQPRGDHGELLNPGHWWLW